MKREEYIGSGLFEAAKEEEALDKVYDDICGIKDCFSENQDFLNTLCSPFLSIRERRTMLENVLKDHVHPFVLNSLKLLYEDKTQCSFDTLYAEFLKAYEKEKGILCVKVYSARSMPEGEKELLKRRLERETGKTVVFQLFTDEKLIGGLKYEYDNKIFDGGVSGNLLHLKEKIASVSAEEISKGVN